MRVGQVEDEWEADSDDEGSSRKQTGSFSPTLERDGDGDAGSFSPPLEDEGGFSPTLTAEDEDAAAADVSF